MRRTIIFTLLLLTTVLTAYGQHQYRNFIQTAGWGYRPPVKDTVVAVVDTVPEDPVEVAVVDTIIPEPVPVPEPVDTIVTPKPEFHWVLFFYDFDKDVIKPSFEATLDSMVNEMAAFPDANFIIEGHTDARGTFAYNDDLSIRRANDIKRRLVAKGIKKDRLTIKGYGKRQYAVPNAKTEAEHARNRRVEVKIVEPEK